MSKQEYSFTKIFWKKLRRNKGGMFGLLIIVLSLLMALLAYVIAPDSTPDANRIIVEIAAKKPGYKQQFMRVPKIKMDKTHPLKGIFWGKEEAFEYIPITSYKQSGDTLFVEKYIDDGHRSGDHAGDVADGRAARHRRRLLPWLVRLSNSLAHQCGVEHSYFVTGFCHYTCIGQGFLAGISCGGFNAVGKCGKIDSWTGTQPS